MFSSISFMFSLSLAFITWSILCYLKLIEEHRQDDFYVELYTEHAQRAADLRVDDKAAQCPESKSDIDKYLNFFWVFACLCALTKLIKCIECYMEKRIRPSLPPPPPTRPPVFPTVAAADLSKSSTKSVPRVATRKSRPMPLPPPPPKVIQSKIGSDAPNDVETEKIVLQLQQLESRCSEMQKVLAQIKDTNTELVRASVESVNVNELQAAVRLNKFYMTAGHTSAQSSMPSMRPHNVFISNSHIHISGQIFVNQRNININLSNPLPVRGHKESEFRQIWAKFIAKPNVPQPLIASVARRNILI